MANELAADEGQPPDSVTAYYFKTSDAETAALDAYISNAKELQAQGKTPNYIVGYRDCIAFCYNGLYKANVDGPAFLLTPPILQDLDFTLNPKNVGQATGTKPTPEKDKKSSHKQCLQDRDGNCAQ